MDEETRNWAERQVINIYDRKGNVNKRMIIKAG